MQLAGLALVVNVSARRAWSRWSQFARKRDTCSVLDKLLTRRNVIMAEGACAVGMGAAGWLLRGLVWAAVGLVTGLLVPAFAFVIYGFCEPDPAALIAKGRPQDALRLARRTEREARQLARKWPSFCDVLAYKLGVQSDALHALGQDAEALRAADESVAIYQALAEERPARYAGLLSRAIDTRSRALAGLGQQAEAITTIDAAIRAFRNLAIAEPDKYLPVLAEALACKAEWLADIDLDTEALTNAHEAAAIYWHKLPSTHLCVHAARSALLEGRPLCGQDKYNDAARMLARGWTLADRQQQQEALTSATPAIRTAYHADPNGFVTAWRTEFSRPPKPTTPTAGNTVRETDPPRSRWRVWPSGHPRSAACLRSRAGRRRACPQSGARWRAFARRSLLRAGT